MRKVFTAKGKKSPGSALKFPVGLGESTLIKKHLID